MGTQKWNNLPVRLVCLKRKFSDIQLTGGKTLKIKIILSVLSCVFVLANSGIAKASPQSDWSQIAIVWPHDGRGNFVSVNQSRMVNISVWPRVQVSCHQKPEGALWIAKNNNPAQPLSISPQLILRSVNGVTFPSLDFNNIPADFISDSSAVYHFAIFTPAHPPTFTQQAQPKVATFYFPNSNVWTHAAISHVDFLSVTADNFKETSEPYLGKTNVDARIQSVVPHDEQGQPAVIGQATRLDVTAEFFLHGTQSAIGAPSIGYSGPRLLVAKGNEPLKSSPDVFGKQAFGEAKYVPFILGGRTWYPKIIYQKVQVNPQQSYQLALGGFDGYQTYSSFWTYAPDIRTNLPNPPFPPSCVE